MKVYRIRKYFLFNIVIAFIVASIVVYFSAKGFVRRIELASSDLFFKMRPSLFYSPHIAIIEIDDDNIAKVGRWPWKRTWHAAIAEALKAFGAKYIYFDIIFSEPASKDEDALFAEAIKKTDNVYLPFAFPHGSTKIKEALMPIPPFSSYIKGVGSINVYPDIDGVLRRIPLFFIDKEGIHLHIALRIAMDYLNMRIQKIDKKYLTIGNDKETINIPLVDGNKMLINWVGKWKHTFKHFSFIDVLRAYKDYLEGKQPSIDTTPFKDSICIVAVTAMGLYDIKPTPLQPEYPGVGATITAINNIIERQFIKTAPLWATLIFIYILALLPPLLISEERPLREILSLVSVIVVVILGYFLFRKGIMIDIACPLLSLFGSYIAVGTYNFARISIERKSFFNLAITDELTGLYNIRYFNMLLKTECLMANSDLAHAFCILMIDIDHFKKFNDTYGHHVGDLVLQQVAKVLMISVRSSDVSARYGGEEMIVILRGTFIEGGLSIAEKIRSNIERHLVRDQDNIYKVTVSIGVSVFRDGDDENSIVKRADDALYKAKRRGRNCIATVERPT